MNLFAFFEVGRRALSATQLALEVAGNNIANVNTPGFSRRRIDLATTTPQRVPGGYVGQGVDVTSLHRVRDFFLAGQIQDGLSTRAGLEQRREALAGVEAVLGNLESAPIGDALEALSRALSDVSGNPESLALRSVAVSAADGVAGEIRSAYKHLTAARAGREAALGSTLDSVNGLSAKIVRLNQDIRSLEATGDEASDLRDARDLALADLAGLVEINVATNSDGTVGVDLAGGGTLLNSDSAFRLVAEADPADPGASRVVLDIPGNRQDVTGRIRGGSLGGLLAARDTVLAGALAELDTLAAEIAAGFNAASGAGFDLNGAAGGNIFTVSAVPGVSAATSLKVDAALLADPALLAAAGTPTPGDGSNASALAAVTRTAAAGLGGASIRDAFNALTTRIGGDLAGAQTRAEAEGLLVSELQALAQSVSGVSLDEEAVSLVQYQRAYEASARFISILDEITQVAVNLGAR